MIILKIDVKKLLKEEFFVGQKGTYVDLLVYENDEPDQYGNTHVVKQGCKQGSVNKPKIVGNGKQKGRPANVTVTDARPSKPAPTKDPDLDASPDLAPENLPF